MDFYFVLVIINIYAFSSVLVPCLKPTISMYHTFFGEVCPFLGINIGEDVILGCLSSNVVREFCICLRLARLGLVPIFAP